MGIENTKMRNTVLHFILIIIFALSANAPTACAKERHPCDFRISHEKSDPQSNCSLRDINHLWCSGGLHDEWTSGSQTVLSLTLCDWPGLVFDPQEVLKRFPFLKKFTLARSNLTNLSSTFPAEVRELEVKMHNASIAADTLPWNSHVCSLIINSCGQKVNFTGTKLEELSEEAFTNLTSLRTLDLRNNALTEISPRSINASRHLQHIYLSGNPWKCNENMSWILDMRHNALGKRISDRDKMHCGVPYEDRPLVPVVEIIITLKEECKRTVCDCELVYVVGRVGRQTRRQLMAFVTTNCSDRGLTELPTYLPGNTTTLHLKGNKISDLSPLATNPVYKQVLDLYLDGNHVESISQLEGSYWLDHFRVLSLHSNRLTDLPTYALENVLLQSDSAVSIYLGDNPWRCDCLFTPGFRDLLIRYTKLVKDVDDVRCHSAVNEKNLNKQIRDLTRTEICIDDSAVSWLHPLDVLNIILGSLIVLIIGKLLYDYWSFKKTGKLPWIVAKIP